MCGWKIPADIKQVLACTAQPVINIMRNWGGGQSLKEKIKALPFRFKTEDCKKPQTLQDKLAQKYRDKDKQTLLDYGSEQI